MSNILTAPPGALRADALEGVRMRRILALGFDLVLVAFLAAVLGSRCSSSPSACWFFLPPLFPLVAFFYNGSRCRAPSTGTPGMRAMDLEMRMRDTAAASSLRQRGRAGAVLLSQLVFPADIPGDAGRWREALPARHLRGWWCYGGCDAFITKIFSRGHSRPARSVLALPLDARHRGVGTRDARGAGRPAVLSDRPFALPLSAGDAGAQGVHPSRRQARRRAQRHADPDRLSSLADDRLSPGLRELPRLRFGARARRRIPAQRQRSAASCAPTPISSASMVPAKPTAEQYSLFRDYLDARHPDGGMADMSVLDYSMMVEDSHIDTVITEYRPRGPDTFITAAARAR